MKSLCSVRLLLPMQHSALCLTCGCKARHAGISHLVSHCIDCTARSLEPGALCTVHCARCTPSNALQFGLPCLGIFPWTRSLSRELNTHPPSPSPSLLFLQFHFQNTQPCILNATSRETAPAQHLEQVDRLT